jgi:hypothetical protein
MFVVDIDPAYFILLNVQCIHQRGLVADLSDAIVKSLIFLVCLRGLSMIISGVLGTNDFPTSSPFPTISAPPVYPPSSTPAASILQQNTACCLLSSALSICTSLTPQFTVLPPTQQASCLCYSSTAFAPQIFDGAVETCADYASIAAPVAYTAIANLQSFCGNIGPGPGSSISFVSHRLGNQCFSHIYSEQLFDAYFCFYPHDDNSKY